MFGAEVYKVAKMILTISIQGDLEPQAPSHMLSLPQFSLPPLMSQEQDESITTDSRASICVVVKNKDSLQALQQCKHKVMLEDYVTQIFARKGLQIKILKAKSQVEIREM